MTKAKPRHSADTKNRAVSLRRRGLTHREIAAKLEVSRGSAHLWTRGVRLSHQQKLDIEQRRMRKIFTPSYKERLSIIAKKRLVHPRQKYSKSNLLEKILKFSEMNGRMPLKREFNLHYVYKKYFGSWNTAIRRAGFSPNPELFAHKFIAKDGHKCDSFTERLIDDWLFQKGITHQRSVRYGDTNFTADFLIRENVLVEFFGLAKVQRGGYDTNIARKRELAKKLKLRLLEIYPGDVYPKNRLSQIIQ